MRGWLEKCTETQFREKEDFYSKLNMEVITDGDIRHMKRIWKGFEIENKCNLRDFYVQGNSFMLADVFENFRNMCHKIYELEHDKRRIRTINQYWYMLVMTNGISSEKYVMLFIDM